MKLSVEPLTFADALSVSEMPGFVIMISAFVFSLGVCVVPPVASPAPEPLLLPVPLPVTLPEPEPPLLPLTTEGDFVVL